MAYLKKIQGEKSHAHSEQRKKWLKREENYNLKGKDLLLRQKRRLWSCQQGCFQQLQCILVRSTIYLHRF